MKKTNSNGKSKRTKVTNIIIIIVAACFFVTGVVLLLIDPIKSRMRMNITEDALTSIEAQISKNALNTAETGEETTESTPITIIVPKEGFEVAGESYDFYGEEEELQELYNEVEDMEANLPDNISLTCIGILKIDKINLNLPCWHVASRVALRYGLGHYEESVMPGESGNSTILGHRNQHTSTMFYRLKEVKKNDTVRFLLPSGRELVYKVKEVKFVSPEHLVENIVGDASSSERLTLVTCATERGKGYRRLVICVPK
ncbi:LPXTG-site transpeptidase (sortase) family protein [Ruminococcaceae bacterium YRB3002]|nr:LPXTG-site transpeptidase (sortase) family protein [Ruminococcaceae bacterium YRB3002]